MAFLVSTGCYGILFDHNELFKNGEVISMIGALCLAFIMGLADDAYNTKPWLKFFVQIACGLVLIFGSLWVVNGHNFIIQIFETDVLNYIITILWIIGIMNSINLFISKFEKTIFLSVDPIKYKNKLLNKIMIFLDRGKFIREKEEYKNIMSDYNQFITDDFYQMSFQNVFHYKNIDIEKMYNDWKN